MADSADPRPSKYLMLATFVAGGVGLWISFSSVMSTPASLSLGCLLAVGATGVLSFVRHSIFHRSDAARMGWDFGRRNNFQIEVGLANLAWGLAAILAVTLDWGLRAEAMTFLVFGFYLTAVAAMQVLAPGDQGRSFGPLVAIAAFGVMLTVVGVLGMTVDDVSSSVATEAIANVVR